MNIRVTGRNASDDTAGRQVSANKWGDALTTLDRLRELPPPISADPRIDLAEAQAARLSSDLDRARLSALEREARARGGFVLIARKAAAARRQG